MRARSMHLSPLHAYSSHTYFKKTISLLLCLSTLCWESALCFAATHPSDDLSLTKDLTGKQEQHGAVYVSGDAATGVMMKVNLWGAVNKPGIHYVPVNTDLPTILSYAGGPADNAELDNVTIKRGGTAGTGSEIINVNMNEVIKGNKIAPPPLVAGDIVVIPGSKPAISQNTMNFVSIASMLVSMTLVGFLIKNSVQGK